MLGSALLLLALGVSAYAAKDLLHIRIPLAGAGAHGSQVQLPHLSVASPVKQPAPQRGCCDSAIAECLACTAGISVERYCSVPQTANVDGCEKMRFKALAAVATTSTTTTSSSTRTRKPQQSMAVVVEGRTQRRKDKWRSQADCCTTATAPCVACAMGMSVEEYCSAKNDANKAPGCEEIEAEKSAKEEEDDSLTAAKEQASMEEMMRDQYEQMQKQLQAHEMQELERQRSECCGEHSAKCLACAAGLSLKEYCDEGGDTIAPGCEALTTSTLPTTTTELSTTGIRVVIRGMPTKPTTSTTMTTTTLPGLSLFCFALMLPWGYEPHLMKKQLKVRKSIFDCDESAVYSSEVIDLGEGFETHDLGIDLHCKYGGQFHTVLNTPIFQAVWARIAKDGRYRAHDWTVKADPDTVFFPQRLQRVLRGRDQLVGEVGNGTFLNNCGYGLHGPLEVLSRRAIEVYAEGVHSCDEPPQEDVYLQKCMLRLGVLQVNHFNLLAEAHCSFEDWEKCTSDHVSFHPFKKWKEYERCLHTVDSRE